MAVRSKDVCRIGLEPLSESTDTVTTANRENAEMVGYRVYLLVVFMVVTAACSGESTDSTIEDSSVQESSTTSTVSDSPTTTTAPTTTIPATTTTTTMAVGGTFEDPVQPGDWVRVGTVDVVVLAVDTDATDDVLEENQFNDPPVEGNRFVMWRVAVSNAGDEATASLGEVSFSVVGPSAVAYDSFASCGVVPDGLDLFRDVFPGGSLEGNLCWEVSEDDADALVLLVDEFSFAGDRVVFAAADSAVPLVVEYPTPAIPDPDGPIGSRGNPLPLGETVTVGDWEVSVTQVVEDATDAVLAENQFNDPPADGHQFVTIGIEATYTGTKSDTLGFSVSFNTVGPLAVSYTGEDTCGVIPDGLDSFAEVFPSGRISGNLCWSVRTDEADDLVMYVQEALSFDESVVFVGLR